MKVVVNGMGNYLLNFLLGTVIPAAFSYLVGRYLSYRKERMEEKAAEEKEAAMIKYGLQSLLRYTMLQDYYKHKASGLANADDKSSFEALHTAYAGLGKNGVMDTIYKEYMFLPDKDGKDVQ